MCHIRSPERVQDKPSVPLLASRPFPVIDQESSGVSAQLSTVLKIWNRANPKPGLVVSSDLWIHGSRGSLEIGYRWMKQQARPSQAPAGEKTSHAEAEGAGLDMTSC